MIKRDLYLWGDQLFEYSLDIEHGLLSEFYKLYWEEYQTHGQGD